MLPSSQSELKETLGAKENANEENYVKGSIYFHKTIDKYIYMNGSQRWQARAVAALAQVARFRLFTCINNNVDSDSVRYFRKAPADSPQSTTLVIAHGPAITDNGEQRRHSVEHLDQLEALLRRMLGSRDRG